MRTLCIYHGNCQDGFAAAWCVRRALGEGNVDFHPGIYQDAPPDVTDRDVLIVDFSYKRAVLDEMAAKARSILVLDHHKSAAEDLAGYPDPERFGNLWWRPPPGVCSVFDMDRSGAGITWDFFREPGARPRLIDHIEDRDLWRFRLPQTREITAALFSYPYDFSLWDTLIWHKEISSLAIEGEAILRKHDQDIANLLPVVQREMTIGGVRMPVANLPLTMTSDAGQLMASRADGCAACYWDTPDGRVFSLRSTVDGPDVSLIAKGYGGGGHRNASGFRMPIGWEGDGEANAEPFDWSSFNQLRKTSGGYGT